jgi:hypothetical protein
MKLQRHEKIEQIRELLLCNGRGIDWIRVCAADNNYFLGKMTYKELSNYLDRLLEEMQT